MKTLAAIVGTDLSSSDLCEIYRIFINENRRKAIELLAKA